MGTIFDVAQLADNEAVVVKLRNGSELRALDLLPEVVDGLGSLVDKRAKDEAQDEVKQREYLRVLGNEDAGDDEYAQASAGLTELTTTSAIRSRQLVYEQLAAVFRDPDGKRLTVKFLREQIPLNVANQISDALTRQILGRRDGESGNAPGSDGAPTPTGSTS